MKEETIRLAGPAFETLVRETLLAIARLLDTADDSPHTREQREKLRRYEEAVAAWAAAPPSQSEREATFEHIVALHAKVNGAKRAAVRRASGKF